MVPRSSSLSIAAPPFWQAVGVVRDGMKECRHSENTYRVGGRGKRVAKWRVGQAIGGDDHLHDGCQRVSLFHAVFAAGDSDSDARVERLDTFPPSDAVVINPAPKILKLCTPCGTPLAFTPNRPNIHHVLGRETNHKFLSLCPPVGPPPTKSKRGGGQGLSDLSNRAVS